MSRQNDARLTNELKEPKRLSRMRKVRIKNLEMALIEIAPISKLKELGIKYE